MMLLITVIMYFELHMAAMRINYSPAVWLTSALSVRTHLESEIGCCRGINLLHYSGILRLYHNVCHIHLGSKSEEI